MSDAGSTRDAGGENGSEQRKPVSPKDETVAQRSVDDLSQLSSAEGGDFPSRGFLLGPVDEPVPKQIGPYFILERLGEGGFGIVYRAERREPHLRRVALKVLSTVAADRGVVARFQREAASLARMSHPHIAHVYDAGATDDGRLYYAMELVEGTTLTEFADQAALDVRERLELFLQVCEAVAHAHLKMIVHRDLKPGNILVSWVDGRPVAKVIDFGIAKELDHRRENDSLATQEGDMVGTPEYMSPEQALGSPDRVDARSDIYALGAIVYELLVGLRPLEIDRRWGGVKLQAVILEQEPPRLVKRWLDHGDEATSAAAKRRSTPREIPRLLRGDLEWITTRALAKEPERRYRSAGELADDIRRHLRSEPVSVGPPAWSYRARKFARRHRGRLAAISAVVLAAALVAGGAAYSSRQARLRQFQELEAAGRRELAELLRRQQEIDALELNLTAVEDAQDPWQPPWERREETTLRDQVTAAREAQERGFGEGVLAFGKALQLTTPGSELELRVRAALDDVFWLRYQEALETGAVRLSPEYFRRSMESQGSGKYAARMTGSGRLTITTEPPGADVFCFRFVERDQRLVPLPFDAKGGQVDPDTGIAGEPRLLVEKVRESHRGPFLEGDRIVAVNGNAVRLLSDLAEALKTIELNEAVAASVLRGSEHLELSWIPYPAPNAADSGAHYGSGRVVDPYSQFGIVFAASPLELLPACRLGGTTSPLQASLPPGSYLLVIRGAGHAEARYPIQVDPGSEGRIQVHLYEEDAVPQGFVHIPAGTFTYGRDATAYLGLDEGREHLPDFFLGKFEVTLGDYLPFLNDLGLRPMDGSKSAPTWKVAPRVDYDADDLKSLALRKEPLTSIMPRSGDSVPIYIWMPEGGGAWALPSDAYRDLPVFGISMTVGLEYAAWLTRRHQGRWQFRLPKDLEWEKAARGADRRTFVWGNKLFRCFSNVVGSVAGNSGWKPVGCFPTDESVYGIRDLTGSVSEPTMSKSEAWLRMIVRRGADFDATDPRDLRVTTRNRSMPNGVRRSYGLRLVAEPPRPAR